VLKILIIGAFAPAATMERNQSDGPQSVSTALTTEDIATFRDAVGGTGRLIGIDAGTKTYGLALSDVTRTIASALETIERRKFAADMERLFSLAATHGVTGLVSASRAILRQPRLPRP
jgi:hypothetical protein